MRHIKSIFNTFIFSGLTLVTCQTANAVPLFFETWGDIYPNSNSDDIGCQLCHQNEQGGDGWNAYGFDIRFYYTDVERNIENAFSYVESLNSDGDEAGLTNLEEIERSMNPGWVNSQTNTIAYKDLRFLLNQTPPFQEIKPMESTDEDICVTIMTKNNNAVSICL